MQESRTIKSLKNAEVSIIYYTLNLILGFWSRNIFYKYLGSEVLGLDTTAYSLLSFLNLAELGVGSSVAYFLYRPMFDKDTHTVNEIVALQGWIYRRIATFIIFVSVVMMCFFPWIFAKMKLPLWYAYCTFLVMLFGSLLGYFINYRQCVLNTDQKGYKVTQVTSGAGVFFKLLLILLLPVVSNPYVFYILTSVCGSVFGCLWLNYILKKEYPWLHKAEKSGKELLKKYPDILKTTGLIFFHQISWFIVFKVTPFIMYAFTSLTTIAYYGNYLVVVDNFKNIINMAYSSTANGVGNLIASDDKKRIMDVFWELTDSRLCISFGCLLVVGIVTEPFISAWLSPMYLLDKWVLFLVCLSSWLFINRNTVDQFRDGYCIYQDIWAPMVEGVINLGVAIVGGYYLGIKGVLLGAVVSTLLIIYGWRPYYLYRKGFKLNAFTGYFIPILKRWLLLAVNAVVILFVISKISYHPSTIVFVCLYGLMLGIVIVPLIYIEFLFATQGTRDFNKRMIGVVKAKLNKR